MSNRIKEIREQLRIAEKKLERCWTEERHQEFLRLTNELVKLEANTMNYNDIQKKYENAGCIDYKLRNLTDLKNIIGLDIKEAKYFEELSQEYKDMTVNFLLKYLNGCGLQYREGYRIEKAFLCQKQELLTEKDEDGCRTIVGDIVLNVNDTNNIKIERLDVPEDFEQTKDSLMWRIEKCYGENTFLRVDLIDKHNSKEWFHVYMKNGELQFY